MAIATTSQSGTNNLGGLEALARSLSSAARDLSQASGFARQGQSATRHTDETLRAIRAVAQQAANTASDSEEHDGLQQELRGLRDTVSRIQSTSFDGLPVFSGSTLRVQVQSADLGAASAVELTTSADARSTLQAFGSNPAPDLASIDQALEATEVLHQEFEIAARRIEGSRSIVAQERVANIASARDSETRLSAEELVERITGDAREQASALRNAHDVPATSTLLALLEEPT